MLAKKDKAVKKLLNNPKLLCDALLNSVLNHDLHMARFLVDEMKVDVCQNIQLEDGKTTSFVVVAMTEEVHK